ncbi:hypothetical protein [Acinetobacter piscicola]|uniref:hypothetical protein n=1 Tax=Acinetobacter piscicola TaxID=2006115 RepID=UPI001D1804DF|nr:hypothetical protein [Acinetobacter piscicola]
MKIQALCLSLSLLLMACSQEIEITPNILPHAIVGQNYDAKIEIEKVTLIDGLFVDTSIPINSRLKIYTGMGQRPYHDHVIKIKGIPTQLGTYRVVLEGETRNTYGGNIHFRKEYTLVVVK